MFYCKKGIANFMSYCLSVFMVFLSIFLIGAAAGNINDKVARIDMSKAGLDDVIRIFGEPDKYTWGGKTFTKNDLPEVYLAIYKNGFSIVIKSKRVSELRFESPDSGYMFRGKIQVGSTLDEVIAVVGQPKETVISQPLPSRLLKKSEYQL